MHPYYDYDYCCIKLQEFGRDIRDKINKDMPTVLTDILILELLMGIFATDIPECPFCQIPIEETFENMKNQWEDRRRERRKKRRVDA